MQPSNRAAFALALLACAGVLVFNVLPWADRQVRAGLAHAAREMDRFQAARRHTALNAYIPRAVGDGAIRGGMSRETLAALLGPPEQAEPHPAFQIDLIYGDYRFEFPGSPFGAGFDPGLARVYGPPARGHSSCYVILSPPRPEDQPPSQTMILRGGVDRRGYGGL